MYQWVDAARRALPGLAATFVGVGMGRFSWTVMAPLLVAEDAATQAQAATVAAWLLGGYTVGAFSAAPLGRWFGLARVLRAALVLSVLALGAEALGLTPAGFAATRFAAGVLGAVLMVLGPSGVLRVTPPDQRARVSVLIYAGIGLGIAVSGMVVPLAGESRLAALVIAGAASVGLLLGWRAKLPPPPAAPAGGPGKRLPMAVAILALAYSCHALGYVPHTVYWGDFIATELGQGVAAGGSQWVLFGIGALLGPPLAGKVAHALGFRLAFALALGVMAAVVALPGLTVAPAMLVASSVAVGALVPGVVMLASGRLAELSDPHALTGRWALLTGIYAIFQAISGAMHAALFALFGSYRPLFLIAGALLVVGMVLALIARPQAKEVGPR